ncbi:hypothetical protein OEZ85_009808 [Tetradesmus obliquus]|uniref:Uncharacterized protein n=1 Tax=Tetradesmus obliquus TaxID=3088 RepID=A0ABY8UA69_TETOB|nr:hypothetical protein OEZ85_009808 [Tetradesmus obliquus]
MLQPSALRARDVTLQELLANIDVSADGSGGVRVALPPVPPPNRSSGSNSSANKRPDDRGLPPVVVNIKLSDLFPPEPSGRRILLTDSSSSSSGDASSIASTPASAAGSSRHLTASLLQAAASPSRSASSSSTGLSAYMRSNPSVAPDLQELTGGRRNPSISDSSEASSVKLSGRPAAVAVHPAAGSAARRALQQRDNLTASQVEGLASWARQAPDTDVAAVTAIVGGGFSNRAQATPQLTIDQVVGPQQASSSGVGGRRKAARKLLLLLPPVVGASTGSSVAESAVTASSGSSLGLSEWARDRGSAQDVQDLKTAVGKQALAPSPRLRAEDVKLTDVGGR